MQLTRHVINPPRTTPQYPQNLLRPSNKGRGSTARFVRGDAMVSFQGLGIARTSKQTPASYYTKWGPVQYQAAKYAFSDIGDVHFEGPVGRVVGPSLQGAHLRGAVMGGAVSRGLGQISNPGLGGGLAGFDPLGVASDILGAGARALETACDVADAIESAGSLICTGGEALASAFEVKSPDVLREVCNAHAAGVDVRARYCPQTQTSAPVPQPAGTMDPALMTRFYQGASSDWMAQAAASAARDAVARRQQRRPPPEEKKGLSTGTKAAIGAGAVVALAFFLL